MPGNQQLNVYVSDSYSNPTLYEFFLYFSERHILTLEFLMLDTCNLACKLSFNVVTDRF